MCGDFNATLEMLWADHGQPLSSNQTASLPPCKTQMAAMVDPIGLVHRCIVYIWVAGPSGCPASSVRFNTPVSDPTLWPSDSRRLGRSDLCLEAPLRRLT